MLYLHGIESFVNSIQGVSMWALRKGFAEHGIKDNEFIIFPEMMDSKSLFLTANADTYYVRTSGSNSTSAFQSRSSR